MTGRDVAGRDVAGRDVAGRDVAGQILPEPQSLSEEKPRPDGSNDFSDSLATVLGEVSWDFEDVEISPLTTTERFFRDFPWDGD